MIRANALGRVAKQAARRTKFLWDGIRLLSEHYKFVQNPGCGIPTRQQNKNVRNLPHVTSQTEINPRHMATKKERHLVLEQWTQEFPTLVPWKDQYLIRRTGPLISGICLDRKSDPKVYCPTFFFHNLLTQWPNLTLGYAASAVYRGMPKLLKYGAPVAGAAWEIHSIIEPLQSKITFSSFVRHMLKAKNGLFGFAGSYLPHDLRDIITVGSYLGDADYYRSTLDLACTRIAAAKNINLSIIGSIAEWRANVEGILDAASDDLIERHMRELHLPQLIPEQMGYVRLPDIFSIL